MGVGKGPVVLTSKDRKALETWVDKPGAPLRLIIRAWIILLSASGHSTSNISSRLGVCATTVLYWRNRFLKGGVDEISEKKNITRRRHDTAEIQKIIEATKKQFPNKARRWSVRNMAEFMGISRSAVQRIWKRHGLNPFRDDQFKFEHDPGFYESCKDIAGLYIESDRTYAVALLADPTMSRTGLPRAPDEKNHPPPDPSQASLLVPRLLRVMGRRNPTSVQKPDMLEFLKWVDSRTPPHLAVHLIVPRSSLTLHPPTFRWLKRHTRFQRHVIPKEVSPHRFLVEWVEKTSAAAKKMGAFPNLPDMERSILEFVERRPDLHRSLRRVGVAQPFLWVRLDRNYLADERQLELDLLVA